MIDLRTLTEDIGLRILARGGIAVVWQLQVAAAALHRTGNPSAAASILEIAEVVEREWLRQGNAPRDWQP
jgi:hypothetical protein